MRVDESLFYLAERSLNDAVQSLTLAKNCAQAPYPPEFKYKAEIEGVKMDFDNVANGMFSLIAREEKVRQTLIEVGMLTEKTGPLKLISSTQMSGYSYDINSYEGRVNYIYDKLVNQYGYSKDGAMAIMANMLAEDPGLNPDRYQSDNSNMPGYGLCQWEFASAGGSGRAELMVEWCSANGYDYKTIDGQLAWMNYDLQNNFNQYGLYDCLINGTYDYNSLSKMFCNIYEVPDVVANDPDSPAGLWRATSPEAKEMQSIIEQSSSPDAAVIQEINTIDAPLPDVNSVFDENYVINQDAANVDTNQNATTIFFNDQTGEPTSSQVEVSPSETYGNIYIGPDSDLSSNTIYVDSDYAYESDYTSQVDSSYVSQDINADSTIIQKVIALYNGEYGDDEASRRAALGSDYDEVMGQLRQNILDGHYFPEDMILY